MNDINKRRIIGLFGILLPVILILVNIIYDCNTIQPSISHYYYTASGPILTGVLFFIGASLIMYGGYDKYDRVACSIAGISAVGIAVFPTNIADNTCQLYSLSISSNLWHLIFSGIFFTILAIISLFLFTKTGYQFITRQKLKRNNVYIICGMIILLSMLSIALKIPNKIIWAEWVGLAAFGVSWLIKGNTLLKDK